MIDNPISLDLASSFSVPAAHAKLFEESATKAAKNADLMSVTPSSLARLLRNAIPSGEVPADDASARRHVFIIDCRYDYEYDGGHIKYGIHAMDPVALHVQLFSKRDARIKTRSSSFTANSLCIVPPK